ncbi:MAG: hypothetical protein ACXW5U_10895 [Thermoanaerobaculia bacterium]
MPDEIVKRVRGYQRQVFAALDEFFRTVTGTTPEKFVGFTDLTKAAWPSFAKRFNEAMDQLRTQLEQPYRDDARQQFRDAGSLGGVKLVLGGGSRFYGTQSDAVRRTALYADTILIPDPVFAWMEADRQDDAFSPALELFKTTHSLLILRPAIESDVETLPFVLFPSFEKSLENNDPQTQLGIRSLATAFINAGLGTSFALLEEVFIEAAENEDKFISAVERAGLFTPRKHDAPPAAIRTAIHQYRDDMVQRRGPRQAELAQTLNDGALLALAILESVAPQYHLFENSIELGAQPLMCFPNHWFYYRTLAGGVHRELVKSGFVSPKTVSTVEALQQERFGWMSDVDVPDLVRVRESMEFIEFRRTLDTHTAALAEVRLSDIDRVGAEVAAGIASLLDKHNSLQRKASEDYDLRHRRTAIGAAAGVAVTFLPALASVISGVGAFAVLTSYLRDKLDERAAKRQLSRSLLGVLARAHRRE